MKLGDIGDAADTLATQLDAGVDMADVLANLQRQQPQHAELWETASRGVRTGGSPLSKFLDGVWPETMVTAVKAGESSGTLVTVLEQVDQTVRVQLRIRALASKLIYPGLAMVGGLGGFLLYMVFVLPSTRGIGKGTKNNPIYQLSGYLEAAVLQHWALLLTCTVCAGFFLVSWVRSDAGKAALTDLALSLPLVSKAASLLSFGVWAKYLSLAAGAGIPTIQAIAITAPVLPGEVRESVELFAQDLSVRNKSMADAADLRSLGAEDLRTKWWPVLIANAFIQADKAGVLELHMAKASPRLIEAGQKAFERLIVVLNVIALALAAILILTPLAAFYLGVFM